MSSFPYIFTFYSFKGGVGRSMAVLNCAYALAGWGRRVLVLDMDLEAPGLSRFLAQTDETEGAPHNDVLDLAFWACDVMKLRGEGAATEDFARAEGPALAEFASRVKHEKLLPLKPRLGDVGQLDFILARGGDDYFTRLEQLKLHELSGDKLVLLSKVLRVYLKTRLLPVPVPDYYAPDAPNQAPYDYVLIDSRTGITEIGGLCIGPLADRLVVLSALNAQNLYGTAEFLRTVGIETGPRKSSDPWDEADRPSSPQYPPVLGPKPTLLVVSPVPTGEMELKRTRIEEAGKTIGPVGAKLLYHPRMALIESVFVRDFREEYLAKDYIVLGEKVVALVSDHPAQLASVFRYHQTKEKNLAASVHAVLRLTPQNPDLGEPLLQRLADSSTPASEEEFRSMDGLYSVLTSPAADQRAVGFAKWGDTLTDWADRPESPLSPLRRTQAIERYGRIPDTPGATAEQKTNALFNRAVMYSQRGQEGDWQREVDDYSAVIAMPDAPAKQKAKALFNRGVKYSQRAQEGDWQREVDDYSAVIAMPDAPPDQKAQALVNRGVKYSQRTQEGDWQREVDDYSGVIAMGDAPADQKAQALVNRGVMYTQRAQEGDWERAADDYSGVIATPDAPAEQKAQALFNRGVMYSQRAQEGDWQRAVDDYSAVIAMADAPPEQKAQALVNRGVKYSERGQERDWERAVDDYSGVIATPDAPAEQKAAALVNRGVKYSQRAQEGDWQRAVDDYSAVIAMADAPAEQKAKALVNRGVMYSQRAVEGDWQRAVEDYSAVIAMADAPPEQKGTALLARGVTYTQRAQEGDWERGVDDYSAVIAMADAPPEQKGRAHANLGWRHYKEERYSEAIAASEHALELEPNEQIPRANLGLALLHVGRVDEALAAYRTVAEAVCQPEELERIALKDLREARAVKPNLPGAREALDILEARMAELNAVSSQQ